jgi:hypothetical protein
MTATLAGGDSDQQTYSHDSRRSSSIGIGYRKFSVYTFHPGNVGLSNDKNDIIDDTVSHGRFASPTI